MVAALTGKFAHFGEWLYAARQQARMSQEEVADRAGVSKNYVSILERNMPHRVSHKPPNPSREKVRNLALAVGADVNDALLVAGYAPEPSAREEAQALLSAVDEGRYVPVSPEGEPLATKADLERFQQEIREDIRRLLNALQRPDKQSE